VSRARAATSASLAAEAVAKLGHDVGREGRDRSLGDRNRDPSPVLDPHSDGCWLDLDATIVKTNFERHAGLDAGGFTNRLGDDEASSAVNGDGHGIPLP
jgi:hypothetical protein